MGNKETFYVHENDRCKIFFAGKEYVQGNLFTDIIIYGVKIKEYSKYFYYRHSFFMVFGTSGVNTMKKIDEKEKVEKLRIKFARERRRVRAFRVLDREDFIQRLYDAISSDRISNIVLKFKVPELCLFENVSKIEKKNFTELFEGYLQCLDVEKYYLSEKIYHQYLIQTVYNEKEKHIGVYIDRNPYHLEVGNANFIFIKIEDFEKYAGKKFITESEKCKFQKISKFNFLDV